MASIGQDALMGAKAIHTVGQVNSWNMETFINGALVEETDGIDNFRLVELYYNAEGEACVKYATAAAVASNLFVTVTPEERLEGEQLSAFYNGKGDRATLAYLPVGFTFETSAITASTVAVGDYVIQDGITGKFKKDATGLTGVATAEKAFQVSGIELDAMYSIDSQELVQLTVIK